jgi:hypothetical protein
MRTFAVLNETTTDKLAAAADWLVVAIAVVLPWSTSAVSILTVVWVLVLLPTLTVEVMRWEILSPFGGLPVLLFLLGVVGMIWADVSWHDRFGGLGGFLKLLAIPLLAVQFARSERGKFVFCGFLASCCLLLIASLVIRIWPNLPRGSHDAGVIVKAYIIQSIEFTVCAAALIDIAICDSGKRPLWHTVGMLLLAAAFLSDVLFIATGRTALVIIVSLCAMYGLRRSGWKGGLAGGFIAALVLGLALVFSPYLRDRITDIRTETQQFLQTDAKTSSGLRIAFWQKSVRFIAAAPVIGNGTGSIGALFTKAAADQKGALGELSTNPHNQTFAVGIQIGFVGIAVLWVMWIVQLARFWTAGFIAWIGLVLSTQNVVGSLFNSFIFDFTEGWLYVLGVGIAAGMLTREQVNRAREPRAQSLI